MGSSDSGKFSGQRSNFSQTCSLLSQYLKGKGGFGELNLGLSQNSEDKGAPTPIGTMDLLPMIEKSGRNSGAQNRETDLRNLNLPLNMFPHRADGREETLKNSDISGTKSEAESAQMTIFYAGQVIVLNDFPVEKANEIMMLASKSSSTANNYQYAAFAPSSMAQSPAESVTSFPKIVPTFGAQERAHRIPQPPLGSDLPIARKNSLARFLEKRKDRITANEPYQARKPAAPFKQATKNGAWLGLGPQIPLQIQRH